jgi:rhodanese-related sulfurtransferase
MSETEYFKTIMRRYWKVLLKWLFHVTGLPQITVNELYDRINSGRAPLMLDIRSPEDYNGTGMSKYGHILDARHMDILELESHFDELEPYRDKEIVTMCQGGGLSLAAVELLLDAGFKDVKSLRGGTDLWHKRGYSTSTAVI